MKIVWDFSRYTWVAIGSTVLDWIVYAVLNELGVFYIHAQMTSRTAGGVFSYAVNKRWSFKCQEQNPIFASARRFLLLYCVSYGLSIAILWGIAEGLGFGSYVAKLLADTTCFLFNFLVMRMYVFHSRDGFMASFRKLLEKST